MEDALGEFAGKGVHAELRRVNHLAHVVLEGGPVWREVCRRDAEERGEDLAVVIVSLAFAGSERGKCGVVGDDSAFHERGKNPDEGMEFVGLVRGSLGPSGDGMRKFAADGGVQAIKVAGGLQCLVEGAKDHGEDDAEGVVKAGEGIGAEIGVVIEGDGDPGMGELEQGGAAGGEKERGFAVDTPADGSGAEETDEGVAIGAAEGVDQGRELRCAHRMSFDLHKLPFAALRGVSGAAEICVRNIVLTREMSGGSARMATNWALAGYSKVNG